MFAAVLEPRAAVEFIDAINWYKSRSIRAAAGFEKNVFDGISAICNNPYLYRKIKRHYRQRLIPKYPFSIIFFIDETENLIVVNSIFHHRRNPHRK